MTSTRHVQNGQYIETHGISAHIHCDSCKPFENEADCTMLPLQDPRRQGNGPRRLAKCSWCTTQGHPCSNASLDPISLGLDRPDLPSATEGVSVYQTRQEPIRIAPSTSITRPSRLSVKLDRRQIAQAAENRQRSAQSSSIDPPAFASPQDVLNDNTIELDILTDEESLETPRKRSRPSPPSTSAVTQLPSTKAGRQAALQLFGIEELLENALKRVKMPALCSNCKDTARGTDR